MTVEGDYYQFHGPASGMFGRQHHFDKNDSVQNVQDTKELITTLAAELERLLPNVSAENAKEVRDARLQLTSAEGDRGKLKAALQRAAGVAVLVGDIGTPVIEAVHKLASALGLS